MVQMKKIRMGVVVFMSKLGSKWLWLRDVTQDTKASNNSTKSNFSKKSKLSESFFKKRGKVFKHFK